MLRVSKDEGGLSFETHCYAMLLRMRPSGAPRSNAIVENDETLSKHRHDVKDYFP